MKWPFQAPRENGAGQDDARLLAARYEAALSELVRLTEGKDPLTRWDGDTASEEDVYYCYRLIYGRNPTAIEWPTYREAAGTDLRAVVRNFLTSREGRDRFVLEEPPEQVDLDGFSILIPPNDISVGRYIRNGSYEPHVANVFRSHLKPGMTVADIGANLGYFTFLSARLIGHEGLVYAIEANPRNALLLSASLQLNSFGHVRVFPVAAGREAGALSLSVDYSNGVTSALPAGLTSLLSSTLVPCVALDSIIPRDRRIDFLKLDIEGAELNALSGFRETIERDKPVIVSEFCPGALALISGARRGEYLEFLASRGYRIGVIEPDGSVTQANNSSLLHLLDERDIHHLDILAVAQ